MEMVSVIQVEIMHILHLHYACVHFVMPAHSALSYICLSPFQYCMGLLSFPPKGSADTSMAWILCTINSMRLYL